ncbi:hypothetical protein H671_6g15473 [Cricetulus griseus]|nr:hypothetical protein H671_6g15473 [Cricetulus griseus]
MDRTPQTNNKCKSSQNPELAETIKSTSGQNAENEYVLSTAPSVWDTAMSNGAVHPDYQSKSKARELCEIIASQHLALQALQIRKLTLENGAAVKVTARTSSSSVVNRYGERGQPYLVPNFSGIALNFSPFNLMLAFGLPNIAFIMFRYVPYIPVLSKTFIMKEC